MGKEGKVIQIGVLMGSIHTKHPIEVLRGIYAGASGKNVNLTIFPTALGGVYSYWDALKEDGKDDNRAKFIDYNYQYSSLYDYSLIADLDVLIVAFGTVSMFLSSAEKKDFFKKFEGIPTIIIQEYDNSKNFTYIIADNYRGIRTIVDHLIEVHEKKHIVCLSGPHMNTDSVERLRGYYDSLMLHGMKIEARMIAYGDYTENVEHLVRKLLDENPEADAMVCANDEMAITAYRVCREYGKNIGKDFAITGFDDVEMASRLNPPLTTVRQDGFMLGLKAMEMAVEGVTNDKNEVNILESPVIFRESCGCEYAEEETAEDLLSMIEGLRTNDNQAYRIETASEIADKCMRIEHNQENEAGVARFFLRILEILDDFRKNSFSPEMAVTTRNKFDDALTNLISGRIPSEIKWEFFTGYLHRIILVEMDDVSENDKNMFRYELLEMAHQHIESLIVQKDAIRSEKMVRRYWDVPIVIQHYKELAKDWKGFFDLAVRQIQEEGASSCYIYLSEEPVKRCKDIEFECPTELILAAELKNGVVNVYPEGRGERINTKRGFTKLYPDDAGHNYEVFLLFSEEEQYGIMICEIPADQVNGMQGVGMQISSGLSYLNMVKREESIRQELYDTLRILREKNKILSTVSSNDPMTGIFNRRGFMERVLELNRLNDGKKAALFFVDLDHLKEINDRFGHLEGDYAITQLSRVIQNITGVQGCCGRVGGDEFIAMIPGGESAAKDKMDMIKAELDKFNRNSNKPYYVEASVGYKCYTCTEDVAMDDIINMADEVMYHSKASRRESIVK